MNSNKNTYIWFHERLWLGLIFYWLVSMLGAGLIKENGGTISTESGWVVAVMLTCVIICMIFERGEWSVWKRVGFVFLSWILQVLLGLVILPIAYLLVASGGKLELVDRFIGLLSGIPIILYSMWHSRIFIKNYIPTSPEKQKIASEKIRKFDDKNSWF